MLHTQSQAHGIIIPENQHDSLMPDQSFSVSWATNFEALLHILKNKTFERCEKQSSVFTVI